MVLRFHSPSRKQGGGKKVFQLCVFLFFFSKQSRYNVDVWETDQKRGNRHTRNGFVEANTFDVDDEMPKATKTNAQPCLPPTETSFSVNPNGWRQKSALAAGKQHTTFCRALVFSPIFSAKVCRRAVEVEITSRCERRRGEYAPLFTVQVSADQLNVEQHVCGAAKSTKVGLRQQTKTHFYHQWFQSKAFCGRNVTDCKWIIELSVKERSWAEHKLTHCMLEPLLASFHPYSGSERRQHKWMAQFMSVLWAAGIITCNKRRQTGTKCSHVICKSDRNLSVFCLICLRPWRGQIGTVRRRRTSSHWTSLASRITVAHNQTLGRRETLIQPYFFLAL